MAKCFRLRVNAISWSQLSLAELAAGEMDWEKIRLRKLMRLVASHLGPIEPSGYKHREDQIVSSKVNRYREYAANARRRSDEAYQSSYAAVEHIPFGQPILVSHHSEGRHRRALERQRRGMTKSIQEGERAEYWERRAAHVEYRERQLEHAKALSDVAEGHFETDEEVIARFTNCNRFFEFRGVIVGRTKNDWKVKALVSPYEGEQPGRVFYIPTISSRKYSRNNCIAKLSTDAREGFSNTNPCQTSG